MTKTPVRQKVVRASAKGQIHIPKDFCEALGIDQETLLSSSLVGDYLELMPMRTSPENLRRYTEEDISRFLKEDKVDEDIVRRVRELLQRGLSR